MANGSIVTGTYNNADNTARGTFTMTKTVCPLPDVTVTMTDIMNGSSGASTTSAGTLAGQYTATNSLVDCGTAGETLNKCAAAGEKCAAMQTTGALIADVKSYCVAEKVCGSLGKLNNVPYILECWGDAATTAPVLKNPTALLTSVELIITLNGAGSWTDVRHLKVPSAQNYQTGWWTRADNTSAEGVWAETDKPVNNLCNANADCTNAGDCCATWPDTNNKRCTDKTKDGIAQTIAPFAEWTPKCAKAGNPAPISAADDLANRAIAKASEELVKFNNTKIEDLRTASGYKDMDDAAKAKFDETQAKNKADKEALLAKLRLDAGIDGAGCDKTCQSIYADELLKWEKAVLVSCTANEKSIECRESIKIRTTNEAARKADGYYSKDAEGRSTFDTSNSEQEKAEKSKLTAAWLEKTAPAAGAAGSKCSATNACTTAEHCCGTATAVPKEGVTAYPEITGICVDKVLAKYTDDLARDYTHECGAKALLASATAIFAAVFMM
jgi:hypothetical protein